MGEGVRTAGMLLEVFWGELGSYPWHGLINPRWVELEWTVPSASLITPAGAQEPVSVCAVWVLRRPGHGGAIQGNLVGDSVNPQNLKAVKSRKFYRNH